jgi:hypothetical protein
MKYVTTIDGQEFEVEVVDERHIRIGERLLETDFQSVSGQPVFSLILDGKSYEGFVYQNEENWDVLLRGRQYQENPMKGLSTKTRKTGMCCCADGSIRSRWRMSARGG